MTEPAPPPPRDKPRYYQLANYNLAICSVFLAVDFVAVVLRVWARKRQKLSLRLDDWLVFPAYVLMVGSTATMIHSIRQHAMGYPIIQPTPDSYEDLAASTEQIRNTSKAEYAMGILLVPAVTFVKLSFLAFYRRIFYVHKVGRVRYLIDGTMVFMVLWGITFTLTHIFMCGTDFSAFWTSFEDLQTKCMETMKMLYAFGVTDFVTDVVILVFPLPLLWRLQLKTSRKIAVSAVFLLGSGAVVASAIRLSVTIETVNKGFTTTEDGDLVITGVMSWLQLEVSLAILAACLPSIRPLFHGFSPESVVSSIRSVFSLQSIQSQHSRLPDEQERSRGPESHQNLVGGVEGFAMGERRVDKGGKSGVDVYEG